MSLALALMLAIVRTYLRLRKFRRFFVDDYFFFFAALSLSAGSGLLYLDLPYLYIQVGVESGLQTPSAQFIQQIALDQKLVYAATILFWAATFGVKFSFLFLFKSLIRRVRYLNILWWCVLVVLVPSAILCSCDVFIACSEFGFKAAGECPF